MKCQRDLFKKKKFKTISNKVAINICLSTIESKKQTKQTRGTETELWVWRAFYDGCQWERALGEQLKR